MTIHVTPISAESLGVRSLAVLVEKSSLRILLDAGVSLGSRYGLVPHPKEYLALKEARAKIRKQAERCDLITISHYHFDHYTPTWRGIEAKWTWSSYSEAKEIYGGRLICAKDIISLINPSQRRRGYIFGKIAEEFVKELRYVDSTTLKFNNTKVVFSPPVPHGENGTPLGYLLMVSIEEDGDVFLYCPDVQGPVSSSTLQYILTSSPKVLVIGGPPLYLSGLKVQPEALATGLANLEKVVLKIPLTIIDHHILRDEQGLREVERLKRMAQSRGNMVKTFAEFLGFKNNLLEARRPRLYEESPPDQEFQRWMKLGPLRQREVLPPV